MQPATASATQSNCAMSGWLALDSTKATNRRSKRSPVPPYFTGCCAEAPRSTFVRICPEPNPDFRVMELALEWGVRVLADQLVVLVAEDDQEIQIIVED